ncbi:hypothetical protein ACFLT7_01950 [candidate division KSB1 bacterium]
MTIKLTVEAVVLGTLLTLAGGCADREFLEPAGAADVRPVGEPIRYTLNQGLDPDLGLKIDPKYGLLAVNDPDSLSRIAEELAEDRLRPVSFVWVGLVKNQGDSRAENVFVHLRFAGSFEDSARIEGGFIIPNETILYNVYSVGSRVDSIEVLWTGKDSVTT